MSDGSAQCSSPCIAAIFEENNLSKLVINVETGWQWTDPMGKCYTRPAVKYYSGHQTKSQEVANFSKT